MPKILHVIRLDYSDTIIAQNSDGTGPVSLLDSGPSNLAIEQQFSTLFYYYVENAINAIRPKESKISRANIVSHLENQCFNTLVTNNAAPDQNSMKINLAIAETAKITNSTSDETSAIVLNYENSMRMLFVNEFNQASISKFIQKKVRPQLQSLTVEQQRLSVFKISHYNPLQNIKDIKNISRNPIRFKQLCDFYSSFTADHYIISTHNQNEYPASEMIAAIALATEASGDTRNIYVTDPACIDLEIITTLAPNWNAENSKLKIYYLYGHPHFSLLYDEISQTISILNTNGPLQLLAHDSSNHISVLEQPILESPTYQKDALSSNLESNQNNPIKPHDYLPKKLAVNSDQPTYTEKSPFTSHFDFPKYFLHAVLTTDPWIKSDAIHHLTLSPYDKENTFGMVKNVLKMLELHAALASLHECLKPLASTLDDLHLQQINLLLERKKFTNLSIHAQLKSLTIIPNRIVIPQADMQLTHINSAWSGEFSAKMSLGEGHYAISTYGSLSALNKKILFSFTSLDTKLNTNYLLTEILNLPDATYFSSLHDFTGMPLYDARLTVSPSLIQSTTLSLNEVHLRFYLSNVLSSELASLRIYYSRKNITLKIFFKNMTDTPDYIYSYNHQTKTWSTEFPIIIQAQALNVITPVNIKPKLFSIKKPAVALVSQAPINIKPEDILSPNVTTAVIESHVIQTPPSNIIPEKSKEAIPVTVKQHLFCKFY